MQYGTSDALLAQVNSSPDRQRPTKRQKVTRACDRCKSRKRRCNGEKPCSVCISCDAECTFDASYTRGKLVGPRCSLTTNSTPARASAVPTEWREGSAGVGERGVGLVRHALSVDQGNENGVSEAPRYAGTSSAHAFLKRAWERFGKKQAGDALALAGGQEDANQAVAVFSYGDRQLPIVLCNDYELPERVVAESLLVTYFDFAMPTYRFLHRQTVEQWLVEYYAGAGTPAQSALLHPVRQAIVLMVLATASLFTASRSTSEDQAWHDSERLYQAAQRKLADEKGRAHLESVQARFASCLYLLHTSRPNEAWYNFGTTVQMSFVLGLHQGRERTAGQDAITQECRKRSFWAIATLDIYLSVMLGRPPLIHDGDVGQQYPRPLDDEDLQWSDTSAPGVENRDKVVHAFILHCQVARIVRRAMQDQASASRKPDERKIEAASRSNNELAAWHASLPVILSGAVHPSSLIPVFRRQVTVLRFAHAHTAMLINRPMLLIESTRSMFSVQSHIDTCMGAAKTTLDLLTEHILNGAPLTSFWFTQYVAFTAASIIYVWLIQRRRGRLAELKAVLSDEELLQGAMAVQEHFAASTHVNAPSLRYNIVLEELQQEARRLLNKPSRLPKPGEIHDFPNENLRGAEPQADVDSMHAAHEPETRYVPDMLDFDTPSIDIPLDPDLWLQLDSFPFSDLGMEEWTAHI